MASRFPEPALGTVQFGLAYGIAGSGRRVVDAAARSILRAAQEAGIRMLDTAPAYGDIEERLVDLLPADSEFVITSKISPLPAASLLAQANTGEAVRGVIAAIDRSVARLGGRMTTILFHRAEDLDTPKGPAIWDAAREHACRLGIRIGISLYDPTARPQCCLEAPADAIQCPANVLDQRLLGLTAQRLLQEEVHIRSAFLQGLLLLDLATASARLPNAVDALSRWHRWCEQNALSPLRAALGFVKYLPARYCLFGVDSLHQFSEIIEAWSSSSPISAPELAITDNSVVDPRSWPAVSRT